jgi:hypothetical protein
MRNLAKKRLEASGPKGTPSLLFDRNARSHRFG